MSSIEQGEKREVSSWDVIRGIEQEFSGNGPQQAMNLILLYSLAIRQSTDRYQHDTRQSPKLLGVNADHLAYIMNVEIADAASRPPTSMIEAELPMRRVYDRLLEASSQSEAQFKADLLQISNLKEEVLLEGAGTADDTTGLDTLSHHRGEVKAWDFFVRRFADREFRVYLGSFIRHNEPATDGLITDELYFEYTDPLYWISIHPEQKNLLIWIAREHLRIAEKLGKIPYLSDPEEFYGSLEDTVTEGSAAFERGMLLAIREARNK